MLKQIELPSPDRPAREMQREPAFTESVFQIRDIIDKLEILSAKKAESG